VNRSIFSKKAQKPGLPNLKEEKFAKIPTRILGSPAAFIFLENVKLTA
jgi:hypothetical protein